MSILPVIFEGTQQGIQDDGNSLIELAKENDSTSQGRLAQLLFGLCALANPAV
jgi:hypothetical protein